MIKRIMVITTVAILYSFFSFSQVLDPVKWTYSLKKTGKEQYELYFKAKIDPTWHLYSQTIPENGPRATSFSFTNSPSIEFIGKPEELSKAIQKYDSNFSMLLKYYADEAVFVQKVKIKGKVDSIKGSLEFMTCDNKQCLPPKQLEFTFVLKPIEIRASSDEGGSLWSFILLAFACGLLALITPCVFPMIPMTVCFFMHQGKKKSKSYRNAIIFGLSIIVIYTAIGSLIAVLFGVDFTHWLSTHWLPNILFFIIFMVFAASFLGMFEITLPSWIVNKSDKKADEGGISGAFFMALTTVLVSFSCTGPIVGTVLVESVSGQLLKPILGMLAYSLAFSIPFTLFALFPSWLGSLPKSGGWLNTVKVVLGFLELALGLKFLSIADQTYHWRLLDREIYLAFWIVIFTLMGLYILGKLKFSNDIDLPFISVPRLIFAIITFTFVLYLFPGMFGAPLKALSGYLPPQQTHDFDINDIIRQNTKEIISSWGKGGQSFEVNITKSICDPPKYADFLKLPHGLEGYFDYDQAIACGRSQNKPIFIDFTGHGCVNCREMEARVWANPKVLNLLRNEFVVVALYTDDKKRLDKSEWVKSTYDNKWKKNLGEKYADFQVTHYNVNAQPFYVLVDYTGDKLVNPRAYNLDVDGFVKFLENGMSEFKKRHPSSKWSMQ